MGLRFSYSPSHFYILSHTITLIYPFKIFLFTFPLFHFYSIWIAIVIPIYTTSPTHDTASHGQVTSSPSPSSCYEQALLSKSCKGEKRDTFFIRGLRKEGRKTKVKVHKRSSVHIGLVGSKGVYMRIMRTPPKIKLSRTSTWLVQNHLLRKYPRKE
jgi:hypothetical protein